MADYTKEDIERGKRRLEDITGHIKHSSWLSNTSDILGRISRLKVFLMEKEIPPEAIGTTQAELDDLAHQVYIEATRLWLGYARDSGLTNYLGLLADNFLLSRESPEYFGITEPEIIKAIEYRRTHPPVILDLKE